MPYWTYNKVRERLNVSPWHWKTDIDPFVRSVYKRIVEEAAKHQWAKRIYEDPFLVISEIEHVASHINDGGPAAPEEVKAVFSHGFKLGTVEYVHSCMLKNAFKDTHPVRFFLEPTIAKAFATTSIKGLKISDLPDLPIPCAIYFPDGLIPDSGARPGTIERSVHEVYIVNLVETVYEAPKFWKKQRPFTTGTNLYTIQKNLGKSGSMFYELQITPMDIEGELNDIINGSGGSNWNDLIDDAARRSLGENGDEEREEPGPAMMMRIVINTLLYWKSVDPDILRQINPDYDKVQQRLRRAKGKKREKIKKAIKQIPRHDHLLVGRHLEVLQRRREKEQPLEGGEKKGGKGSPKAWHWTRGHWRWQRCGKGLRERKLIFIDPYWSGTLPAVEKLGYDVRS